MLHSSTLSSHFNNKKAKQKNDRKQHRPNMRSYSEYSRRRSASQTSLTIPKSPAARYIAQHYTQTSKAERLGSFM
eukprot:UN33864